MAVDVGFDVLQREDGTYRVRTNGLGRRGRPEIEVSSVDRSQLDTAADLLGRVAVSVFKGPVYAGQTMFVADELSIELHEAEHMPAGFLARALGASDRTIMRITDAGRRDADGALCAAARLRARELAASGDAFSAARILHDALEAARTDDDLVTGERAQAAVELSYFETDPRRAQALLLEGLRSSEVAQRAELGATFAEIAAFEREQIKDQLQHIATVNLGLVNGAAMLDNTVQVVPSPIWQPNGERAELAMTMIPGPWLRLYWAGVTRAELEAGYIPGLAARIFTALAGREDGVARLAHVVRESEATFPASSEQRGLASPGRTAPHMFLASALLTHVARLRTGELTDDEIFAAFGLNHDATNQQIARDKSRRLRVRLAQWTRDGGVRRRI